MPFDACYCSHPPVDGPCGSFSRDEIAAGTAMQYSILGMSTTFFGRLFHSLTMNKILIVLGTINLFVAGWTSKKFGPKTALLAQVFIPAIRVIPQIVGVVVGKKEGMMIIQATQLVTILGGPAGYM